jgi:hypothetical protein
LDPAALTGFLAPFLPYLMQSGANLAEDAVRALGREAWQHAQQLWAKLRPGIEGKPAAQEAARDVAEAPEDPRARGALELQIEKLLAADQQLADELTRLWQHGEGSRLVVASGDRAVAVGGDVKQSVIQTGERGGGRM